MVPQAEPEHSQSHPEQEKLTIKITVTTGGTNHQLCPTSALCPC